MMAFLPTHCVVVDNDKWVGRTLCVAPSQSRHAKLRMSKDGGPKPEKDIPEKIFSFFFGEPEESPMGLQRFNRDRFPEQYPATLDEFASPVDSDTDEMASFRPLMARTQLDTRLLRCAFDTDRDGWTAKAFHEKVDRLGAAVVLAKSAGGAIFGGYNPKGWVGYGESRGSIAAFLFTWRDGDLSKPAVKLRKVGAKYLAVEDKPEVGPQFGADSLVIRLQDTRLAEPDGKERTARSKLGSYYERLPNGDNHVFNPSEDGKGTELLWMRSYVGVYEEGEEIPFSDALPFSLE